MTKAVRRVAEVEVVREGGVLRLELEDEAGERLVFVVDEEQLDLLADHIDDILGTRSDH